MFQLVNRQPMKLNAVCITEIDTLCIFMLNYLFIDVILA
jgi:hypothetical protein